MIVLDANAAVAIALGTEDGGALKALQLEEELIAAPQLLHAEVAHVLTKYVRGGYCDAAEAVAVGRDAMALVDEYYEDASLWTEALTESVRLGHSSYDLFYLVLARRLGATLFTLDRKLQALCAANGVSCLWIDSEF
ncbi:type II toxin-antitoxin system VapC family toxin [Adlercreutzia sp. R7]|uniref:Ribonuclease VapC n=1 Tax=Adlercreutzia wanghongyangiae TaxID=3111451 RepID=A0ABU6IIF5_9ACTN|nr:type II toxin-antitoxin system VapC family toxin [Adlercreutzia sp. R7]